MTIDFSKYKIKGFSDGKSIPMEAGDGERLIYVRFPKAKLTHCFSVPYTYFVDDFVKWVRGVWVDNEWTLKEWDNKGVVISERQSSDQELLDRVRTLEKQRETDLKYIENLETQIERILKILEIHAALFKEQTEILKKLSPDPD